MSGRGSVALVDREVLLLLCKTFALPPFSRHAPFSSFFTLNSSNSQIQADKSEICLWLQIFAFKLNQRTVGEGGAQDCTYEREGKTAFHNQTGRSAAWIEAVRGWMCTCATVGQGEWRAL